ncbi:hypothetical protein LX36DRAFT_193111 [Colletotrichum falcatum]|nr:hypothetical protein LX36DRAFT_193111 [Colletotrichum falcatum]
MFPSIHANAFIAALSSLHRPRWVPHTLPACPKRLTHASAWPGSAIFLSVSPRAALSVGLLPNPLPTYLPTHLAVSPVRSPRPSGRESSSIHRRDRSNVNCTRLPRVSARGRAHVHHTNESVQMYQLAVPFLFPLLCNPRLLFFSYHIRSLTLVAFLHTDTPHPRRLSLSLSLSVSVCVCVSVFLSFTHCMCFSLLPPQWAAQEYLGLFVHALYQSHSHHVHGWGTVYKPTA